MYIEKNRLKIAVQELLSQEKTFELLIRFHVYKFHESAFFFIIFKAWLSRLAPHYKNVHFSVQ